MEQALRGRTRVKAQNIMGPQSSRKQRRGWRINVQGSCKADFHSQFGNNPWPPSSECPSHLDGIPYQLLQAFLELVYQSGGGSESSGH